MAEARVHTRKRRTTKPRLSKVANATDSIGELSPACEIHCLTFGQFSMIDVLEAVLDQTGPADVTLSTWTAAAADISKAEQFLTNGRIRTLRFLVDCSFPQRQPAYCAELRRLFGDAAIRTTRTHAKFAVITNDQWAVVVRTSMNLNENPRLEYVEITDDPDLAAFFVTIVDEIWAEQPAGQFRTETTPTLAAVPSIDRTFTVRMGSAPRIG